MYRLLSCLLAFAVLILGVTFAQAELSPVDSAEARASLPTCPTSKRPKAKYAKCYIDRSKRVVNNVYQGTAAKEYFDGRAGNDIIVAGGGNDMIIGGPGQDKINAGGGRNTIDVRDNEKDTVVCGAGQKDVVYADSMDVLNRNCKDVRR